MRVCPVCQEEQLSLIHHQGVICCVAFDRFSLRRITYTPQSVLLGALHLTPCWCPGLSQNPLSLIHKRKFDGGFWLCSEKGLERFSCFLFSLPKVYPLSVLPAVLVAGWRAKRSSNPGFSGCSSSLPAVLVAGVAILKPFIFFLQPFV